MQHFKKKQPYPLFSFSIALRYFGSKKSTHAINIIAWISMVAIGVVTAALVVVLSVFNGFENLVLSLYSDFYADVSITPRQGKWLNHTDSLLRVIGTVPQVQQAEPVLQERVVLIDEEDKSIVWLKGVQPSYAEASGVPNHMVRGSFAVGSASKPAVVLGSGVENALQIAAGSQMYPVSMHFANRLATNLTNPLEAMRSSTAPASGSFAIQQDFDNQYAFSHLEFVRQMAQLSPQQSSAIELFLAPNAVAATVQAQLQQQLGAQYVVKTRLQQNQNLFAAMQGERLIIYAVAILIMIIAAFNIVSSLTMTVLEKQQDVAVLQALGATTGTISRIFLYLGLLLAGVGGGAGILLGVAICLAQQQFRWVKLGGQSFLIDYYPVALRGTDVAFVLLLVGVVALLSGWLPSRKAAHTAFTLR
ncbi:MAG: ABC transporter permease [Bacteroidetes bacterium]|nr:MAG: ABC transporter permease [Bacteroidota bacterium]